ncbi:MAG: hypothetical protein IPH12_03050 [Saprospirales bacterium]|nr:hypothetical protein [Saprospirales bacterium]
MKSKCLFHIGCLLLLPALQGNAQPDASAAFDSGYVETGNPFALHLSVPEHYGQPDGADFSTWKAQFPSENILSQTGWKRQGGRWVSDYTLIAFDSAQLALPPLRIGLPGGDTLMTNALELQVLPTPAPGNPAQMLGIKAIRREPANLTDYLKPLWPVAAGVLILALAIWWLLYDRKKTGLQAGHPPPHEAGFSKTERAATKTILAARQYQNVLFRIDPYRPRVSRTSLRGTRPRDTIRRNSARIDANGYPGAVYFRLGRPAALGRPGQVCQRNAAGTLS